MNTKELGNFIHRAKSTTLCHCNTHSSTNPIKESKFHFCRSFFCRRMGVTGDEKAYSVIQPSLADRLRHYVKKGGLKKTFEQAELWMKPSQEREVRNIC